MKIGILTFHRSINYGAVTQCYTLSKELKNYFPNDIVEVIDYTPQFRIDKYKPTLRNYLFSDFTSDKGLVANVKILIKRILLLAFCPQNFLSIRKRYKSFENSLSVLPLSKEKYRQNNVEKFRQEVYGKYDVIVVGSDCVWEWSTVPFPNAYYLCGDFGAKKLTYAASLGTDNIENLSEEIKHRIISSINDFSYVGIRDTSTEYVVRQLNPNICLYHNCDPTTFLNAESLEIYREKVQKRLIQAGIRNDKPIVGIMANNKFWKLAKKVFGDRVYFVSLYVYNRDCDADLTDLSVLEWAASFGLFDLTFTTFFHGTMLSLINNTPVISIDCLKENGFQITKLRELYNRLNLQGFYWRDKSEYDENDILQLRSIANELIKNPPKEEIKREIEKESKYRDSFFEFLKNLQV